MSVIKFKLTEDHIKLIKNLRVSDYSNGDLVLPSISTKRPFGDSDIFDDMFLILYGKPKEEDFNVDSLEGIENPWNEEQLEYMKKLLGELTSALDIVLYTGKFEVGTYKTKTYVRDWKKTNTSNKSTT
ncbi:MAG: hypothetical protein ACOCP8_03485 [archaeon]